MRWLRSAATALACFLTLAFTGEFYARHKGYIPAAGLEELHSIDEEYLPIFDPRLGWAAAAGKPLACGEPIPLFYRLYARMLPDGQRFSRPLVFKEGRLRVLVLGCSIAFGYGLPDQQTFTWLLNKRFPRVEFENFAFPGYSTFQCMMKEESLLEKKHYDLVIYTPFDDHAARNVACTVYTHEVDGSETSLNYLLKHNSALWYLPLTELDNKHEVTEIIPFYRHWPLDRFSAVTNTLKRLALFRYYTARLEKVIRPPLPLEAHEVYWRLLERMDRIAAEHGSRFAVLCLENEEQYPGPLACPDAAAAAEMNKDCREPLVFPPPYTYSFVTNGCGGEPDGPKYRVGGDVSCHPNAVVHASWAQIIGDWFESQYPQCR